MKIHSIVPAVSLAVLSAIGAPASASSLTFIGSSLNVNPPALPGPACPAPLLDLGFGPAGTSGTSNLGSFTFTQAHCALGGPGAYAGGVFEYFFADGGTLGGTYSGLLTPSGTPGLLGNHIEYLVTSGTGWFQGATGFITGDGTVDFRSGVARVNLALDGVLDGLAVPEPASGALLLIGVAAIGAVQRRRGSRDPSPGVAA